MIGIEEGTFWDEHWVLYGNQFDNKFHLLKKKKLLFSSSPSHRFHYFPVYVLERK